MAEFQRYAEDPSYRPLAAITRGSAAAAKAQKDIQQMQAFFNQNRVIDQQRIQDARFAGQDLKDFGEFMPSVLKLTEQVMIQSEKDKAIGDQWDINMPPSFQQKEAEDAVEIQAEAENTAVKGAVNQLDPITGAAVDKEFRQIGRGFNGEKSLLNKVKGLLPGYYTSYLNRADVTIDTPEGPMPIVEAFRSSEGDLVNAALQNARWALIKEYQLQNATKKNFVGILDETIRSTESYMLTNALNANIKQAAADQKESYEGIAYSTARSGIKDLKEAQDVFSQLADQLYFAPNASLTRRQANKTVITSMAAGYVSRGDYEGAESLKQVRAIADQEGTELGYTFGKEIDEAIALAKAQSKKNINAAGELVYTKMRRDLANMPDDAPLKQRQDRIDKALEEALKYEAFSVIDKINGESATLVLSNNVSANDSKLLAQIQSDSLPSRENLEQMFANRKISKEAYDKGVKALEQKTILSSPQVQPVYKRWTKELQGQLENKLGIKKDALGFYQLPSKYAGAITQRQLNGYYAAYERDVNLIAQQSLARTEGQTPEQRSQALDRDLDTWYKNQVTKEGGKYYNDGFLLDPNASDANKMKTYQRFWERWDDPAHRAKPTSFPQQLSGLWNYGSPVPDDVKYAANTQRDYVIGYNDLINSKDNWEAGLPDPNLQLAAADLGISPYTLLNDQLGAYNEKKVQPKVSSETLALSEENPSAGVHAFEQVGFPTKGASYLAMAVAIANGWKNPQALEIDRWPQELEARDPVAFNRLMLPQSSDRHLQAAIESLFGSMPTLSVAAQSLYA